MEYFKYQHTYRFDILPANCSLHVIRFGSFNVFLYLYICPKLFLPYHPSISNTQCMHCSCATLLIDKVPSDSVGCLYSQHAILFAPQDTKLLCNVHRLHHRIASRRRRRRLAKPFLAAPRTWAIFIANCTSHI